jgi:mono/diheme cytochrome c family protein
LALFAGWSSSLFWPGGGYVSQKLHARRGGASSIISSFFIAGDASTGAAQSPKAAAGGDLGEQIYGNNCSSCHWASDSGLAGVFPPLKGNATVLNEDPGEHIKTKLDGVSNKVVDGVNYTSPIPPFTSSLSDEDVKALGN